MDILVPLTENHEYKRVYARGKSAVRPALVLYCLRNKKVKQARVGITASKKIGNAVKRNRGAGAFCVKAFVRCIRRASRV